MSCVLEAIKRVVGALGGELGLLGGQQPDEALQAPALGDGTGETVHARLL
jgi:hypothetical protein